MLKYLLKAPDSTWAATSPAQAKAENLKIKQQLRETELDKNRLLVNLSELIAVPLDEKTIFEKPVTIVRGMNKLQFNFNQLAKGTYILRFADAQGTLHSTKFVKD